MVPGENHLDLSQRNTIVGSDFFRRFAEVVALGNRIRRHTGISCHGLPIESTGHLFRFGDNQPGNPLPYDLF